MQNNYTSVILSELASAMVSFIACVAGVHLDIEYDSEYENYSSYELQIKLDRGDTFVWVEFGFSQEDLNRHNTDNFTLSLSGFIRNELSRQFENL